MNAQYQISAVADGYTIADRPDVEPTPYYNATHLVAASLAKAQSDMSNPAFDAQNPHFRNRYASLAAVRNAVIPILAKHGIALVQDLQSVENGVSCTTRLYHSSGQSLTFGPLVLPVSKADAQGFGSAATYARRYALMAVAGVVGDDDDDAESAVGATPQKVAAPKAPEGYAQWAQSLKDAAKRGMVTLQSIWEAGTKEYRQYAASQGSWWPDLKNQAAQLGNGAVNEQA